MFNIERITGVNFSENSELCNYTSPEGDVLLFDNPMAPAGDNFSSAGGWTSALSQDLNKMSIAQYNWTPISGVDDAINKSSKHLMDLLILY